MTENCFTLNKFYFPNAFLRNPIVILSEVGAFDVQLLSACASCTLVELGTRRSTP
jgi:hypothetical protein